MEKILQQRLNIIRKSQKKRLLLCIRQTVIKRLKRSTQYASQFRLQQINQTFKINDNLKHKISIYSFSRQLLKYFDKNLFDIEQRFVVQLSKLKLNFSPQNFLKITEFIYQLIKQDFLVDRKSISYYFNKKEDILSTFGNMLVQGIIYFFQTFMTGGSMQIQNQTNQIIKVLFTIINPIQLHFQDLNVNKNLPLQKRLGKSIDQLNNNFYDTFSSPQTNNQNKSPIIKIIDFIIMKKISQQNKEISVYSFSLTIKVSEIQDKIKKAQALLKEIFQKYNTDVSQQNQKIKKWNHVILCPPQPQYIQKNIHINNSPAKVQIFTSDLSKFEFKCVENIKQSEKQLQVIDHLKKIIFS